MKKKTFCVSMSTIPSRIQNINDIIETINKQTLVPNRIFLNIPYEYKRFNNDSFINSFLKEINQKNHY